MPYNSSLPKTELQLPTALESMPLKCIRCWILCSPPRHGTEPIRLRIDDLDELRYDLGRLTSWGATPEESRGHRVHLLGSGPFQVENTVSDSVPNQRNFVYRWSPRAGRACWREKVPSLFSFILSQASSAGSRHCPEHRARPSMCRRACVKPLHTGPHR